MPRQKLVLEPLTRSVIGAFYEVYNTLGFGFHEHVYQAALERELITRGHRVEREVSFIIRYKGEQVAVQRLDMLVDEKLVVESKAAIALHAGAQGQVYGYLRASNREVGLLLHFGLEPKFYRVVDSRSRRISSPGDDADSATNADAADRSAAAATANTDEIAPAALATDSPEPEEQ
jgi:GxxExxY protein